MLSRFSSRALGVACAVLAFSARAEVLDKVSLPWSPHRLGATAMALAGCLLCLLWARQLPDARRRALTLVAGLLAALWLFAHALDDSFDGAVGDALRVELSVAESWAYLALTALEAIAPMSVVLLFARRRRSTHEPAPRR